MNPERRLDQLEPLLAEALAVPDQHMALHRQTQAQIRQLAVSISGIIQTTAQLVAIAAPQSDTTRFLLRERAAVKMQLGTPEAEVSIIKSEVAIVLDAQQQILALLRERLK